MEEALRVTNADTLKRITESLAKEQQQHQHQQQRRLQRAEVAVKQDDDEDDEDDEEVEDEDRSREGSSPITTGRKDLSACDDAESTAAAELASQDEADKRSPRPLDEGGSGCTLADDDLDRQSSPASGSSSNKYSNAVTAKLAGGSDPGPNAAQEKSTSGSASRGKLRMVFSSDDLVLVRKLHTIVCFLVSLYNSSMFYKHSNRQLTNMCS